MKRKGFIALICTALVAVCLNGIQAFAEGGRAYFGSEEYDWSVDETSKIGIYGASEDTLEEVEIYVKYDSEILKYESGGELVRDGLVRISGEDIGDNEYKEMLAFTPIKGGDTTIEISEAHLITTDGAEESIRNVAVAVHMPSDEPEEPEEEPTEEQTEQPVEQPTEEQTEQPEEQPTAEPEPVPQPSEDPAGETASSAEEDQIRPDVVYLDEEQDKEFFFNQLITLGPIHIGSKEFGPYTFSGLVWTLAFAMVAFLALLILAVILVVKKKRRAEENWRKGRFYDSNVEVLNFEQARKAGQKIYTVSKNTDSQGEKAEVLDADHSKNETVIENNDEVVIRVRNITMDFKREEDESGSVKELVIRTLKGERKVEKFRALDNISFDIHKGEVVGIIGTNGSGKSTILKIVSGVLQPTIGRIKVNRDDIQLLTLGTGFDVELTGRENVYLNGSLIGYTKEYIDEKYNEIVQFAELEGFMEERVKNYSSGMISRLGFAIATIRDTPKILILDEVLSVGDMFFRKKSEERIQKMIHGGSTVLIVSHSTGVIRKNCTRVIWIEKGRLRAIGDPNVVCDAYEKMNR